MTDIVDLDKHSSKFFNKRLSLEEEVHDKLEAIVNDENYNTDRIHQGGDE